jgi:hypothetical protein
VSGFAEYARRYSQLGWALIRVDGKKAKGRRWQDTQPDPDPEHAAGLWSTWGERWNMGVVLGTSGLAVVEADTDEGEHALVNLLGEVDATPLARSGSGRTHVYFRDPGGLQKRVRDGLELRVGAHQMLVPPSAHPETKAEYEWIVPPWDAPLAELPDAIVEFFAADEPRPRAEPLPEKVTQGARHKTAVSIAGTMRRRGLGHAAILAALRSENEERFEPPMRDEDLVAIADSAMGWQPAPPPVEPAAETTERATVGGADAEPASLSLDDFIAAKGETREPHLGGERDAVLVEGGLTLIGGKGGAGKTTLVIDLGLHLAAGIDWLGIPVGRALRVLMIENEGPREAFREKLEDKRRLWPHKIEHPPRIWTRGWGAFTFDQQEKREELRAEIEAHEIDLVIADPLNRLGVRGVGSPEETTAFVSLLPELGYGRRVGFLFLHHFRKEPTTDEIDELSGAWGGHPDTIMVLKNAASDRARLSFPKLRWAQPREPLILSRDYANQTFGVIGTERELAERKVEAEVLAHLANNDRWEGWTPKEISAPKKDDGIGANVDKVKEALQSLTEAGETVLLDARVAGRKAPNAQPYRLASRAADSGQLSQVESASQHRLPAVESDAADLLTHSLKGVSESESAADGPHDRDESADSEAG